MINGRKGNYEKETTEINFNGISWNHAGQHGNRMWFVQHNNRNSSDYRND